VDVADETVMCDDGGDGGGERDGNEGEASSERDIERVKILTFSLSLLSFFAAASVRGSFKGGDGTLSLIGALVSSGRSEGVTPRLTAAVGRAAAG